MPRGQNIERKTWMRKSRQFMREIRRHSSSSRVSTTSTRTACPRRLRDPTEVLLAQWRRWSTRACTWGQEHGYICAPLQSPGDERVALISGKFCIATTLPREKELPIRLWYSLVSRFRLLARLVPLRKRLSPRGRGKKRFYFGKSTLSA